MRAFIRAHSSFYFWMLAAVVKDPDKKVTTGGLLLDSLRSLERINTCIYGLAAAAPSYSSLPSSTKLTGSGSWRASYYNSWLSSISAAGNYYWLFGPPFCLSLFTTSTFSSSVRMTRFKCSIYSRAYYSVNAIFMIRLLTFSSSRFRKLPSPSCCATLFTWQNSFSSLE